MSSAAFSLSYTYVHITLMDTVQTSGIIGLGDQLTSFLKKICTQSFVTFYGTDFYL